MLISQHREANERGDQDPTVSFQGTPPMTLKMPTLPHLLKSLLPSCSSKLGAEPFTHRKIDTTDPKCSDYIPVLRSCCAVRYCHIHAGLKS